MQEENGTKYHSRHAIYANTNKFLKISITANLLSLITPYHSSSSALMTSNTPSGAKKHHEFTKPESRQMAKMVFLLFLLQTG